MTKVRLVCEAAFMVLPDKLGLDLEGVETVYMVALTFLYTNIQSDFISMAWGFNQTEENFERFIKPWHRFIPLSFSSAPMLKISVKSCP